MTPSRRELLERAGAAATAVAVTTAGWTAGNGRAANDDDDEDDDLPEYERWLALDDGGLEFTYVDWTTLQEYVREDLEEAEEGEEVPEEYGDDPMIAPASEGLLSTYFFVGLTLVPYRLATLLDDGAFESTVEAFLRADAAFVVTGTIEPAEIDEQITAEPELDLFVQMERTDEVGEYDVYRLVEDDDDTAIAVGTDALVIVVDEELEEDDDPSSIVETVVGAAEGDVDRATDESEAFEWLLETAGRGDVAVGQYGGPFDEEELLHPAFEPLEDAEGLVSSLTVEDEETSTGDFAAIVDEPDEDALEALLGASADERSIDVDEDRVTATATWRETE